MTPVASLIEEACESGYLGALRSAAVALRAAAEAFVAMELNQADPADDIPTLGVAVGNLHTYQGFRRLPNHSQGATKSRLKRIWNLGDSGAHLRLRDSSRQVPLEPTAIEDAVSAFEAMLTDVYGWN